MAFTPLKPKTSIMKLSDLYGEWLIGKYVKKTESDYSFIYWIETNVETGEIKKIYGNKSLDSYMDDSLIGQVLAITCTELKSIGKAHPLAIASVSIWDPNSSENPLIPINN